MCPRQLRGGARAARRRSPAEATSPPTWRSALETCASGPNGAPPAQACRHCRPTTWRRRCHPWRRRGERCSPPAPPDAQRPTEQARASSPRGAASAQGASREPSRAADSRGIAAVLGASLGRAPRRRSQRAVRTALARSRAPACVRAMAERLSDDDSLPRPASALRWCLRLRVTHRKRAREPDALPRRQHLDASACLPRRRSRGGDARCRRRSGQTVAASCQQQGVLAWGGRGRGELAPENLWTSTLKAWRPRTPSCATPPRSLAR